MHATAIRQVVQSSEKSGCFLVDVQGSSAELREVAAEGLGELVDVTSQEALRPFTVQITGVYFVCMTLPMRQFTLPMRQFQRFVKVQKPRTQ
jgi:hypothetical protein